MFALLAAFAVIVSAICGVAAVMISANDADASVTQIAAQPSPPVVARTDIDNRFSAFLRDVRAIQIGPDGLVRIPGSAPVLAMHIEPPAQPVSMRGRIEDAPNLIPTVTIFREIKPQKRRRMRRTALAKPPVVVPRQKSLFEALFGVPFPGSLFPKA